MTVFSDTVLMQAAGALRLRRTPDCLFHRFTDLKCTPDENEARTIGTDHEKHDTARSLASTPARGLFPSPPGCLPSLAATESWLQTKAMASLLLLLSLFRTRFGDIGVLVFQVFVHLPLSLLFRNTFVCVHKTNHKRDFSRHEE